MIQYKDKYRIQSTRHPYWDYGSNGYYFVTICVHKKRDHHFGEMVNHQMGLSEIGKIADVCWMEIPNHFPFVILHNHIIMPNHVHGIVQIAKSGGVGSIFESSDESYVGSFRDSYLESSPKETQNIASLQSRPDHSYAPRANQPHPTRTFELSNKNKFGPQSQNLGSIIRGFKIGVTKNARLINPKFK